jgi:hypothetical protein
LRLGRSRQPDPPHLFSPSREQLSQRVPQKRCKVIRCMYESSLVYNQASFRESTSQGGEQDKMLIPRLF